MLQSQQKMFNQLPKIKKKKHKKNKSILEVEFASTLIGVLTKDKKEKRLSNTTSPVDTPSPPKKRDNKHTDDTEGGDSDKEKSKYRQSIGRSLLKSFNISKEEKKREKKEAYI